MIESNILLEELAGTVICINKLIPLVGKLHLAIIIVYLSITTKVFALKYT